MVECIFLVCKDEATDVVLFGCSEGHVAEFWYCRHCAEIAYNEWNKAEGRGWNCAVCGVGYYQEILTRSWTALQNNAPARQPM